MAVTHTINPQIFSWGSAVVVSFFKTFFLGGVKPKMFIRWPQKFTPEYFGAQRRLSDCMEPGSCGCKLSSNHHCSIAALYCWRICDDMLCGLRYKQFCCVCVCICHATMFFLFLFLAQVPRGSRISQTGALQPFLKQSSVWGRNNGRRRRTRQLKLSKAVVNHYHNLKHV